MKIYCIFISIFIFLSASVFAQSFIHATPEATRWADSVIHHLSKKEKITQLMVLRESEFAGPDSVHFFDKEIESWIKKYNIGGICLFQGNPVKQASLINHFQIISKTPLMVCIDAETGLGMRMIDSVQKFPDQLTLGAANDSNLVYKIGRQIGWQCKREGINVDYAPVVDINNNPNNPVINYRSFGENKYIVASLGTQMTCGIQSEGVMACAKHFPGHGDVSVDSHLDLPVVNKSLAQLDSLELYPFKKIFAAGVGSVMIAHLNIPAIDTTAHLPSSLSEKNVTELLRIQIGFEGISFTDALDMKGVTKYFPNGESAAQSLIAGNDMLCLPVDIPACIKAIKKAIKEKKLSWNDIDSKVKKVLIAKYNTGLNNFIPVNTNNLTAELNDSVNYYRTLVAEKAITVLKLSNTNLLKINSSQKLAYVGIGGNDDALSFLMQKNFHADCFYFNYKTSADSIQKIIENVKGKYDAVIIGLHNFNKYPANNFGISDNVISFLQQLQNQNNVINLIFGNPYAAKLLCNANNLVECYEDDSIFQHNAFLLLQGKIKAQGKLPVSVCENFKAGDGIVKN